MLDMDSKRPHCSLVNGQNSNKPTINSNNSINSNNLQTTENPSKQKPPCISSIKSKKNNQNVNTDSINSTFQSFHFTDHYYDDNYEEELPGKQVSSNTDAIDRNLRGWTEIQSSITRMADCEVQRTH